MTVNIYQIISTSWGSCALCATGQKTSNADWLRFWCSCHIFMPSGNGKAKKWEFVFNASEYNV